MMCSSSLRTWQLQSFSGFEVCLFLTLAGTGLRKGALVSVIFLGDSMLHIQSILVRLYSRVADFLYYLAIAVVAAFVLDILKSGNAWYFVSVTIVCLLICLLAAIADEVKSKRGLK